MRKQAKITGFGMFIKSYRRKNKLTRDKLAEILGISDGYLGLLERGERVPSYETLTKAVQILRVTADEALGIDSYTGREAHICELSARLEKIDRIHRDFVLGIIESAINTYGKEDD